ncbi:MAG: addiction module protein [Kiritimatiellae bacterium]|jgi:putative addiction module component (TIGR02574 family)|nr:addiction module protein [Kiritimatiellia bacterium]
MLATKEIIKEVECLPVEERAIVVDYILRTLNPVESEIEKAWIDTAKRRLLELRSGKVQAISGDDVFERVRKRFA